MLSNEVVSLEGVVKSDLSVEQRCISKEYISIILTYCF